MDTSMWLFLIGSGFIYVVSLWIENHALKERVKYLEKIGMELQDEKWARERSEIEVQHGE